MRTLVDGLLLVAAGIVILVFDHFAIGSVATNVAAMLYVAAIVLLIRAVLAERSSAGSPRNPDVEFDRGLRSWFAVSVIVAIVSALFLVGLVGAALYWDWVGGRVSGVLAPLGVIAGAAVASAGAARTFMAQSRLSEQNRLEYAEGLLWKRFDEGAKQLADNHFAIRIAGVHSLVGLADDWLEHHQRRSSAGRGADRQTDECETIVHVLCAQLRRNTHLDPTLDDAKSGEERLVNEAIIGQLSWHLTEVDVDPDARGTWVSRDFLMDLRGTDLSSTNWLAADLRRVVFKDANLLDADLTGADLTDANLKGANLRKAYLTRATISAGTQLDGVEFDLETRWPDSISVIPPLLTTAGTVRLRHNGRDVIANFAG